MTTLFDIAFYSGRAKNVSLANLDQIGIDWLVLRGPTKAVAFAGSAIYAAANGERPANEMARA